MRASALIAALCASGCMGAVHLDSIQDPESLHHLSNDDHTAGTGDRVKHLPGWDYATNTRLMPPVSAVNGLSVPKGLCDTVESVSGV